MHEKKEVLSGFDSKIQEKLRKFYFSQEEEEWNELKVKIVFLLSCKYFQRIIINLNGD